MIESNKLSNLMAEGQVALGTWNLLNDPSIIEILASVQFDFVIIDMEHGAHTFDQAMNLIRAAEARGIVPLLRPNGVDESCILRALDCGVHGLMVPNINSIKQVEELIKFTYYPPIGDRGHSPFTRAGKFNYLNSTVRMEELNLNTFLGILIEGTEGINQLESILNSFSEYLDLVYVGVYDLAKSVGSPGDIKSPKVITYIKEITSICLSREVNVGILCNDIEMLDMAKRNGIKFICYQNDTGIFYEASKNISSKAKEKIDL